MNDKLKVNITETKGFFGNKSEVPNITSDKVIFRGGSVIVEADVITSGSKGIAIFDSEINNIIKDGDIAYEIVWKHNTEEYIISKGTTR